jgi:hypothetical protein
MGRRDRTVPHTVALLLLLLADGKISLTHIEA